MLDDVILRLASLGYTYTTADSWLLGFIIDKVTARYLAGCNLTAIPTGLHGNAVDAVCGEFLQGKRATGQLTGITFDAVVKAIAEGDTNVQYATSLTPEDRFEALVGFLMREPDLASYRRIQW